jgi:hypothetical protein
LLPGPPFDLQGTWLLEGACEEQFEIELSRQLFEEPAVRDLPRAYSESPLLELDEELPRTAFTRDSFAHG